MAQISRISLELNASDCPKTNPCNPRHPFPPRFKDKSRFSQFLPKTHHLPWPTNTATLPLPKFRIQPLSHSIIHSFNIVLETLLIPATTDRKEIYDTLLPQIEALVADEPDVTANLANVAAALKQAFGFFWVGFYLTKGNQLVLGPFQGPVACTRIDFDKGVCGHCYRTQQTVLVPDVEQFPGHIACSSASKSEIVVPVFKNGAVFGVLDVDSDRLDDFNEADKIGLERIIRILEKQL